MPTSLAMILGQVDEAPPTKAIRDLQDRMVAARLGVAGALFTALRAKHSPTAQHCLRVAVRCSVFGRAIGLTPQQLDQLEVAALLHDVGKIGVPDYVLTKPGALNDKESECMGLHCFHGLEILSTCTNVREVLEIVSGAFLRYDGKGQQPPIISGDDLPLGARVLAIADAYDAMTTEHVYRAAMPRERALSELFENAGSQFDPELVREFAKFSSQTEAEINKIASERWQQQSRPKVVNMLWSLNGAEHTAAGHFSADWLFQQRLLDAMYDGVIFVDANRNVAVWNRGAERLSGISRQSVLEKSWTCAILDLRDVEGNALREAQCPVEHVIQTGVQTLRRVTITRNRTDRVSVDMHIFPVTDQQHRCYGATILLHDVSSETTLEKRVQNLHEKATTDPLTGVSNRAEFDRVLAEMVDGSQRDARPFSIVICDVDRFKQVNDVYGHQAGDDVLINFANQLRQYAREGDLVARYGGEEFVMLWPNCDNATAARRAEEIRFELSRTPQPMLNQKCVTSSFGVTEIQLGDTPETILRRADRALYQAKDTGRNRVVQIGAGLLPESNEQAKGWLAWLQPRTPDCLLERALSANVPMNVLVEKIKGFISDHGAEIITIEENYVVLGLDGVASERMRRMADRP
ncbi:MAG: diguanylate cyclase, partial [Planctomycetales bacterium]|nr:diguanylate cyclase [Planctomycetales bacterium]